jgi:hypothetical protein
MKFTSISGLTKDECIEKTNIAKRLLNNSDIFSTKPKRLYDKWFIDLSIPTKKDLFNTIFEEGLI